MHTDTSFLHGYAMFSCTV